MMKYMIVIFLTAALIISFGTGLSAKDDAEKIFGNVEKRLKKLKTVSFSFNQVFYQKVADRYIKRPGKLWLKEPHLIRLEGPAQQVVTDGRTVWMYVPRNKQVTVSTFIQGEGGFQTPWSLFEDSKNKNAEYLGSEELNGEMCDILLLESAIQGGIPVKVWIERKRDIPLRTLEERENGDTVEYVLSDIVLNEKIDDEMFVFVAPEGVETIDLRE
jgi:outer membrane lipoprotein carrier protein